MRKFIPAAFALLLMVSCTKTGPAAFRGYYSFKTGGTIDVKGRVYDLQRDTFKIDTTINEYTIAGRKFRDTSYRYHVKNDTIGSRDTTFLRHLVAESGQMHILDKSGDEMLLTMNITGGDPVVFYSKVSGEDLVLSPTRRMVGVRPGNGDDDDDDTVSFDMTVSGSGKRYENMIIFDLWYEGRYAYDGLEGNVTDSRVNCIATLND